MARHRTLLFDLKRDDDFIVLFQTPFKTILLILLVAGFLSASIFTGDNSWAIAMGVLVISDLILEWLVIIFFEKDAMREGNTLVKSGSIWKGNKQIKMVLKMSTR